MPLHFPPKRANPVTLLLALTLLLTSCNQPTSTTDPVATQDLPIVEILETPNAPQPNPQGEWLILSIEEHGYAHLFLYQPDILPITRITTGDWNDTHPALSPDRKQLAFASDRSGYWDLYLMDLQTGNLTQVTNSQHYDSAPSWSPDGQWLAFETYVNDNLEIAIVNVTTAEIIPLTQHPASDHSPAWIPGEGRQVAFVSSRSGDNDIWLADLDLAGDERYINLSNTPNASESAPVWNAGGTQLLWAATTQAIGFNGLYIWDAAEPTRSARWVGDGSLGVWNESATQIVTVIRAPNQTFLTAYNLEGSLLRAMLPLTGRVRGIAWGSADLPNPLPASLQSPASLTPGALWAPAITPGAEVPNQRWYVVPIDNVQAPYPQLHDLVDEAFVALRRRVSQETGWDALASLENAFVPLTTSLEPGMDEDWLYTGRAFAINSLMSNAGWLVAMREDIGAQTYWRIYIRAATQDGSLGEPLHDTPWNLYARYDLDPRTYEQGGDYAPAPSGYWVDVTSLASAYGWERQPALPNWRTYYKGARFTTFALTSGMSWYAAMRELYPPEALATPTKVLAPTLTPTNTPTKTPTPRPTRTPRPTITPSFTPSITPTPSLTPTPPTIIP